MKRKNERRVRAVIDLAVDRLLENSQMLEQDGHEAEAAGSHRAAMELEALRGQISARDQG